MRFFRDFAALVLGLTLFGAAAARAEAPAEALFRLLPPEAGLTLAVEDLRGHSRDFFASPLAGGLRQLPAVRAWFASDRFKRFDQARRQIEQVLGENIGTIRDELLGDAVVLSLNLAPDQRPDQASGLLLVRVRDRGLLDRLIQGFNAAQTKSGELARVAEHQHHAVSYTSREFRPGTKPTEYYTVLPDRTLVWSNSEALVQGVIDRTLGKVAGLSADPRFRKVRQRLPERVAVSLFADPRFLERIAAASAHGPRKPGEERTMAMLERYMKALDYVGAGFQWREGLLLHVEETSDPERLDPWIRQMAAHPGKVDPRLRRVPPSALAVVTADVDFAAILEGLRLLVPETDQVRFDNLMLAMSGVMLGQDVASAILPQLGPGATITLERPKEGSGSDRLGRVLAVTLDGEPNVAAAVDNGLKTLLAFSALNAKRGDGQTRVESRTVGGVKVTALSEASPFAYAVAEGRLFVGSTPEAVARAASAGADGAASARVEEVRAECFPRAETFAWVDLRALHEFASSHRQQVARRLAARQKRDEANSARDLDQALALIKLFRVAFAANEMTPDATSVHHTIGLIGRLPAPEPKP